MHTIVRSNSKSSVSYPLQVHYMLPWLHTIVKSNSKSSVSYPMQVHYMLPWLPCINPGSIWLCSRYVAELRNYQTCTILMTWRWTKHYLSAWQGTTPYMGNEVTTLLNRPLPEGWFQQSGPHSVLCHPQILCPNLPPLPVPITLNN